MSDTERLLKEIQVIPAARSKDMTRAKMNREELLSIAHNKPSYWALIETAPQDGTEILGYSDEHDPSIEIISWQLAEFWDGDRNGWVSRGRDIFYATHWMPLPKPPIHKCPICHSLRITKSSTLRSGSVRLQCLDCKKQWVPLPKPLGRPKRDRTQ